MNQDLENLLSLIFQRGRIKISDGQLLVAPPEIARQCGDQIRLFKPEILLHFGCCPVCAEQLVVKIEELRETGRQARHSHCQTQMHYDKWER